MTTATYTYNAADELTNTGFTYDANGNLTAKPGQTYAYNSLNQTSSITTSGTALSMAYADVGQSERTTAGSTAFLNGLLSMTRQSGGSTLAFTRTPGGCSAPSRRAARTTATRTTRRATTTFRQYGVATESRTYTAVGLAGLEG